VRLAWEGRVLVNTSLTEEKISFVDKCVDKFESLEQQISTEE
jgi:hypothetical protein